MTQDEHEVRRASIDPERLLPGEDPSHSEPGDPEHWVEVYTQLLVTKHQLVRNLREMMERQSDDVRDELERADVKLLELQIQRFERRRDLWRSKLTESGPRPSL
jgi:hypothetical protein